MNLNCLEIAKSAALKPGKSTGDEIPFICPQHDDSEPSLRVDIAKNCWFCSPCKKGGNAWALAAWIIGSSPDDKPAVTAWLRDHNLLKGNGHEPQERHITAIYDYTDPQTGDLIHQTVRSTPKKFSQRRPDGNGGWIWNLQGIVPVLYRAGDLAEAEFVFKVEGEKDADNLHALGLTATTNPMGAGKWRDEYCRFFSSNQHVTILPDNDKPGRDHAQQVAASLYRKVASIKILELAGLPDKGDVSDWLQGRDPQEAAEELCRLAESALVWTPLRPVSEPAPGTAPDGVRYHLTDSGNAELFASINGGRIRYDHRRGLWLRWGNHCWEHDSDGELFRLAKDAARERYKRAESISDLDQRKTEAKWSISSESRQRIDATLSLARSEKALADCGDGWNADPFLLAVNNGVVDLRTGTLRAGRPEDRINIHCDIDYLPEAPCPRWLSFLEEIFGGDREMIDFIYRSAGYCASGDTREQVLFVCYGTGSNGKGSFLNSIRKALGGYGHNIPFQTLEMQDRGAIPNDLAGLVDRRFVTASETNQTSRLNEARIKALTGNDPISARFMRGEWFTFEPAAKFWLGVNHKPRVQDDSFGFWRRVRLIPFTRQFTGAKADLHLDEKLNAELPGILWWIVCGCLSWQEEGLNPPAIVTTATEAYRVESDLLAEFFAERCIIGPLFTVGGNDLYKSYRAWAEARGMKEKEIMGSTYFGTKVSERFNKKRVMTGVIYEGLGLSM